MAKKIISASITPLMGDGSFDRTGFRNLSERNIRHGLDGLFLFGTMGEWFGFTDRFREEVLEYASDCIGNRMELLAGVASTSLSRTLDLVNSFKKYKFDSYVYLLPGKPLGEDPVKSILTVLDKADRPVCFYYNPALSAGTLTPSQFDRFLGHPNLKGIKNSSCSMWLRQELLLLREEKGYGVLFFEGQEWSIDEALFLGLDGAVCGIGALGSKMLKRVALAFDRGDYREAREAQKRLIRLYHGIYGPSVSDVWTGVKYAMYRMGIISSPFTFAQENDSLSEKSKRRIEACLAEFKEELD